MSLGTFDKLEEDGTIQDDYRIHYMAEHIKAMYDAVPLDGVDLLGCTCWAAPAGAASIWYPIPPTR